MRPVFVTKKNFYRLRDEEALKGFNAYANFPLQPVSNIADRFREHTAFFASKGMVFRIDSELPEMLELIEKASAQGMRQDDILRMLGVITEDVFIGPESIHLDIINYCNLNCIHCWFHSPLRKEQNAAGPGILPFEKIKEIFSTAHKMGVFDILLLGCGETFMHPDIRRIIDLFREYDFHLTAFSNGTLLDDGLIESLASVKEGLGRFYFSICAGDERVYKNIHVGSREGVFRESMNNITRLSRALKEKYRNPPKIILLHVIHKLNCDNIRSMFNTAIEVGADELWFQLTEYTPETKQLRLNKEEIMRVRSQICAIAPLAKEKNLIINNNIDFQLDNVNPETGNWSETLYKRQGCYIGWDFMRIWNNGDVSFCCPPKYMGNVFKEDIDTLWASPHYKICRVAGKYFDIKNTPLTIDGKPLLDEQCELCPNYTSTVRRDESLRKTGLIKYL